MKEVLIVATFLCIVIFSFVVLDKYFANQMIKRAELICDTHGGIKGYTQKYLFNVVVCNDDHKEVIE